MSARPEGITYPSIDAILTKTESKYSLVIYAAKREYEWAIANGIAKEQARAVLPEGLIQSKLYVSGTIRSWIHYCELRSAHGTQQEHMDIAKEIAKAISEIFPMIDVFGSE